MVRGVPAIELLANFYVPTKILLSVYQVTKERRGMNAPVYEHNFANVQDYLHHRHPYLMIGSIHAIGERAIQTSTHVSGDEYFLAGHFPGMDRESLPRLPENLLPQLCRAGGFD